MHIRDRIKELRRVPAGSLRPNLKNWRKHPEHQRSCMKAVLDQVGYADALLVRETSRGELELIDGHLRAEITPNMLVPVLVLDVSQHEADFILATHDPLAAMAETDRRMIADLLGDVEIRSEELKKSLLELGDKNPTQDSSCKEPASQDRVPAIFHVVVHCDDEAGQELLYTRLKDEGYQCRLIVL